MLSIGKLAAGPQAATYYLERVGCPLDYYVGRGEAAGVWMGRGARALGLHGELDSPAGEQVLRQLLDGHGPDGTQLVKPVLRGDPRGRVPAAAVLGALQVAADGRGLDVPELLSRPGTDNPATNPATKPAANPADGAGPAAGGGPGAGVAAEKLLAVWERSRGELDRARRRPAWPAPSLAADTAQQLLRAAGLDPTAVLGERTPTGRFRDVLARALRHREDRVDVRVPGLDLTLSSPKSVSLLWALSGTDQTDDQHSTTAAAGRGAGGGAGLGVMGLGPEVGEQVRQAHRVAVGQCLEYLELTCTDALRGHHRGDGTDRHVGTDGLIGAAFEHRSSRCGDPQLHTHVVVANLLHGSDNKWSALSTRDLYGHARTAGFVYQAVLRGELTRRLGVCWTPVRNGQAEITGMPPGLLRLFSKRRQQIEARLEELGLDSPAAAQAATLDTRPAKPTPTTPGDSPGEDEGEEVGLQERWRAEAAAAGYTIGQLRGVLGRPEAAALLRDARAASAATGPVAVDLADSLLGEAGMGMGPGAGAGVGGLTEKRATFDRRDLLRGVCEHLPAGLPIRLTGLRSLATRVLHDDRVVPLLGDAPVSARRYSTRELLALEVDALALATAQQPTDQINGQITEQISGQGSGRVTGQPAGEGSAAPAFAPVAVVDAGLLAAAAQQAERIGCSAEQTAMLHRLLSSGAGVEVVVGAAGSGKTTALSVAAQAWQAAGIEVQGTALAAIAARVLQDSAGIPSQSLQRLLNQLDQHDQLDQPGPGQHGRSDAVGERTGTGLLPQGGVLIVDEAGMVGTRTLHRLLTLAAERQTKLVLVGDPRQLPEIDAGGLFATLAARLPASTLLGNQRQSSRWEQRALRELRDGDVVRALSAYAGKGRLRIEDGLGELTARLLEDYEQQLSTHQPEQVLVIASSRGDARRLNAVLRQRLLTGGRLGAEELRVPLTDPQDGSVRGERGYRVGEQVLVTVNDYPRGLLNGTRGTITTLHPDSHAVEVRLDDGRQVLLEADYLRRGQLSHGYALTAHKAQGVTVDVALLWGTQALTRETGYVALSRGRHANYLYATWDLLQRDTGITDRHDLERPAPTGKLPDLAARRRLARAALAERLATSGQQRTARSWWRRRPTTPAAAPVTSPAQPGPRRAAGDRSR